MKSLARRILDINDEIAELDRFIERRRRDLLQNHQVRTDLEDCVHVKKPS